MTASERDRSGRPYRPSAAEDGSADMRSELTRTSDAYVFALPSARQAPTELPRQPSRHGEFDRAREAEDDHAQRERARAARTVAGNAHDLHDCGLLLSILGLDPSEGSEDRPRPSAY